MNPKLIFVEGLPNSGKTTTLTLINELLQKRGFKTKVMYETDLDNLLDNHCNAYLTINEYKNILEKYDDQETTLNELSEKFHKGFLIRYWKYRDKISLELFNQLRKYDFYELSLKKHFELVDEMWKIFANRIKDDDIIYIIECALFQNPMHISIVRDNVPIIEYENRVKKIYTFIEHYKNILFYIHHDDPKNIYLNNTTRSSGWRNSILKEYTTGNKFGRTRNLKGEEGIVLAYEELYKTQISLYNKLGSNKYMLDNTNYDENYLEKQIDEKLVELYRF